MKKVLLLFLAFVFYAHGETNDNPYLTITERNAFELTDKEFVPTLPPVKEILAPSVFLTGISRLKGAQKVHLVLRKTGESDKFVSLGANEKQYNVELKKILHDSVLVVANGNDKLLSFETNGLPTTITKRAPQKDPQKEEKKVDERRRQYEEWKKKRER
tara:strand:+ start:5980 stop:6456 length:477 start_codon:yes stop_codon:yes gene_type:complete